MIMTSLARFPAKSPPKTARMTGLQAGARTDEDEGDWEQTWEEGEGGEHGDRQVDGSAQGSMYLYRLQLEKEVKSGVPLAPLPSIASTSTQLLPSTPAKEDQDEGDGDELPPHEGQKEGDEERSSTEMEASSEFSALRNRSFRMESQMEVFPTVLILLFLLEVLS